MTYGLVLAGGKGSRLYPLSRTHKPKQFLDIVNNRTLLYNTLSRISNLISKDNLYVITNKDYKNEVFKESSDFLSEKNIIIEPSNKETAVCIGLAATKFLKKDKDAVMMIFPSDHYIDSCNTFYNILEYSTEIANKKRGLVTIGINPTMPQTGYGYMQKGTSISLDEKFPNLSAYKIERFIEKPNYEVAKDFLLSGNYLWNSGIFCFRADVYLREMEKYLPKVYKGMIDIYKSIGEADEELIIQSIYNKIEGISIDFGIMQKTRKAYVVSGDFEWDDIGNFSSLVRILQEKDKNFVKGNVLTEDCENCLVFGKENLVITFGVKDLIVVNADDVILIMDKSKEQELKHLFNILKEDSRFNNFI